MPYASRAQQGLFHSPNSPVSSKVVKKFDQESKGQHGMPYHKGDNPPELEQHEPAEEALLHLHRTILGRMGEQLAARMPKHEKPPDLPIAQNEPPDSPAKALVEKLKAIHARKG